MFLFSTNVGKSHKYQALKHQLLKILYGHLLEALEVEVVFSQ